MNSLYRCRCRVAYRPYAADYLIVFEERQVANAQINMSWSADPISINAENFAGATQFVNALTGSTAQVTLTDPYMTGASWVVLFDTAAAYTNQTAAAAKNILLPKCEPGQDPRRDKCFNYISLEDPGERGGVLGQFAHILITLYYEVAGVKFSLDTFFRVQGFDISHGKSYPSVTIRGVDPQTISFNQTLRNFQFKENVTLEENLKEIAKQYDHTVSFCNPPGVDYSQEYLMPKNFKERGVTAEEVIRKYVRSVKGTYSKLPIKEYAGKISICTRANVNQGCSVFYLGKGLYEGYSITGGVDPNILSLNSETGNANTSYIDDTNAKFEKEGEYKLDDLTPTRRKEKLKNAKLEPFPKQFTEYDNKLNNGQSNSKRAFRLINSKAILLQLISYNMFGIGTNGKDSIAVLDGKVVGISTDTGRIVIETNYFLRICKKTEPKECFNKVIFQESQKINKIEEVIKYGSEVTLGQKLGGSAEADPEQLRLFIRGFNASDIITLDPVLVKNFAVPVKGLTDEEKSKAGIKPAQANTPSGPVNQTAGQGGYAGRVGSTGSSTGAHAHVEWSDKRPITLSDVAKYLTFGGKAPNESDITSSGRFGDRGGAHKGVDISLPEGTEIRTTGSATLGKIIVSNCPRSPGKCGGSGDPVRCCGEGFGNYRTINTPEGELIVAHLQEGTLGNSVSNQQSTSVSTSSGVSSGVQNSPTAIGAKITTEFMGVPRALRIIPGRTVLNFVTQYDEWVEKGRPADIDPGVWIAGRFSKWFVQSVRYNWAQGSLRVQIDGVTDWGVTTARVPTPTFEEYLKSQNFQKGNNYYNYIRSLGDLCYKTKEGKNSCETLCQQAEDLRNFLRTRNNQSGSGSNPSVGNFPNGDCQYVGSYFSNRTAEINKIIGALNLVGIKNPIAYAGVLGNFAQESGIQANRHRLSSPGTGCSKSDRAPLFPAAFGIAQWCGSRQTSICNKCGGGAKCDKNSSLDCELSFLVEEIRANGPGGANPGRDVSATLVRDLNAAKSPGEAADIFNRGYENGEGGQLRRDAAVQIYGANGSNFKCERKA